MGNLQKNCQKLKVRNGCWRGSGRPVGQQGCPGLASPTSSEVEVDPTQREGKIWELLRQGDAVSDSRVGDLHRPYVYSTVLLAMQYNWQSKYQCYTNWPFKRQYTVYRPDDPRIDRLRKLPEHYNQEGTIPDPQATIPSRWLRFTQ